MNIKQLTRREVGIKAKSLVSEKLMELGFSIEVPKGAKNILIAKPRNSNKSYSIRVKSRRSGDWQIPITEGRSPEDKIDLNEFWVLVDFASKDKLYGFYIMSGETLRRNIYQNHQDYLRTHGGVRPVTPNSLHHSVKIDTIAKWKNRWDLIK